jgi:hypothetical protein
MPAIARRCGTGILAGVEKVIRRPRACATARFSKVVLAGVVLASLAGADTHKDVLDLFASMAAALTEVNVARFMDACDKSMPDYDKLKSGVSALTNQGDLTSSIEPLKDDGDDSARTVDLDWYLQVRSLVPDGPILNRREVIHCELRKEGKRWKIVSLKPIEFFAPAKLDK